MARRRMTPRPLRRLRRRAGRADMRRSLLSASLFLLLCGCALGPDYERPVVDTPQTYRYAEAEARDPLNIVWWAQFHDEDLERLIAIALQENKDMQIAAARVEEFYGRYGAQRGQQFPQ